MQVKVNFMILCATCLVDAKVATKQDGSEITTRDGKPIVQLFFADSDSKPDGNGGYTYSNEVTLNGKCFGATAERALKFCKKGRRFVFSGKYQPETWEDREGKKQSKPMMIVNNIEMADDKCFEKDGDNSGGSQSALPPRAKSGGTAPVSQGPSRGFQEAPLPGSGGENDDLPF